MHAIDIQRVSKIFPSRDGRGDVRAVDGVSLTVKAGELLCLLGPSGCGKTTILRCLAGFEFPTEGRIVIGGKDVTHTPPHERHLPLVFQNYALFPHMTVWDNVAYGLRLRKTPADELRRRVGDILDSLGLAAMAKRHPDQMSGGQQQRVALARALVLQPNVLLFDEPLSNLDAKLRQQMRIEIKKLQQRLGVTSVYVTHDQEEAMSLADQIAIMRAGRIEQRGTPEAIYERPVNHFVADFMGHANFLPARVIGQDGATCVVEALGVRCRAQLAAAATAPIGGTVTLVLRYEMLTVGQVDGLRNSSGIAARPGQAGACKSAWTGTVSHVVYLGERVVYELQVQGTPIYAVVPNPQAAGVLSRGATVSVSLPSHPISALLG